MAKGAVIGLAAHVDAGKTTLSEAMLYLSGAVRRQGRVDHGDAFLDHGLMEAERGITIFSKEARLTWKKADLTMIRFLLFVFTLEIKFTDHVTEKQKKPPNRRRLKLLLKILAEENNQKL